LLQVYYDKSNGRSIEAIEHPFEVPLVDQQSGESLDLPLVGRIDLIETGPVIVDLKTSAYKPDPKDVNMNLQMTAYSYAYHHITGEFPKLRMDYLIKTKTPRLERVKTSRNSLAFRKLFLLTKEVLNGIRSRIFFPNPSWRCGDCEYRQVCWMFNGLSKQT